MGGVPPLGYDVRHRSLVVNETEAATVKLIYKRYLKLRSVRLLKHELDRRGMVSKIRVSRKGSKSGGQPFSRGALYELLANPLYIGEVRHRNERHSGQHEPILERRLWEKTQRILRDGAARGQKTLTRAPRSPLAGKLFDENGEPLYVQGAANGKRRYRYYVSRSLVRGTADQKGRGWRVPAPELERAVTGAARAFLDDKAAVLTALQESEIEPEVMDVLKLAENLSLRLARETEGADTLTEITETVQLTAGGIRVGLKISLPKVGDESTLNVLRVTRLVSVKIRRRGVEMRLVLDGRAELARKADPALLKAVARARRWFEEITSGPLLCRDRAARGFAERLCCRAHEARVSLSGSCRSDRRRQYAGRDQSSEAGEKQGCTPPAVAGAKPVVHSSGGAHDLLFCPRAFRFFKMRIPNPGAVGSNPAGGARFPAEIKSFSYEADTCAHMM